MNPHRKRLPDPFAVAAFAAPLAVYLATLAPTVFWLDAGIYLAAAEEFGIAYPPGFPLYVILAHIAGAVPLGSFAERVHALSALAAALTCFVLYRTLLLLLAHRDGDAGRGIAARCVSLVTALGAGFSFALWSQAVNAEVYALQALITALLLLGAARAATRTGGPARRDFVFLAVTAGLGFANHPMIVGMIPPLLALLAWHHLRNRPGEGTVLQDVLACLRPRLRAWLPVVPLFLLSGLLPYAYLPLRSRADPLTDWGDPETASNFLKLVTASHWTAETSSFSFFGAGFFERVADALMLFALQFGPAAMIAAVAGAVLLYRKNRFLFAFFALTSFFAAVIPLFYTQTKEFESWFLAGYLPAALCAGLGAFEAARRLPTLVPALRAAATPLVLCVFALLYPGFLLYVALPAVDRSGDYAAEDYARGIVRGVGRDGILFISGDNPSSTVLFAQAVLGLRRDVTVVNQEALQSAWYRGYVRKNLGLRLETPPLEAGDARDRVTRLVLQIAKAHPERPAFVLMPSHLDLPPATPLTPSGMVFRLGGGEEPPPFERWDFEFHDPDVLVRDHPKDQRKKINEARREMRAGFLRAFRTGADAFFRRGRMEHASRLYAQAWRLAPEAEEFGLRLGVCLVRRGEFEKAREVFLEVVERLPNSYQGYYNLGNVLAELGDDSAARRAWMKSLEIRPDFAYARQALGEDR